MKISNGSKALVVLLLTAPLVAIVLARTSDQVALTFSGGHLTDRRDGGRPVVLVAGALGVPPEVFREAFGHVHPARGSEPTYEQVHQNKRALLDTLGKYGVTNDRLDQVSNRYRYRRERGEMWPTAPAKGYAIVENGKVTSIVITDQGYGYSSPPAVSIDGTSLQTTVKLVFNKRFEANGAVASVAVNQG